VLTLQNIFTIMHYLVGFCREFVLEKIYSEHISSIKYHLRPTLIPLSGVGATCFSSCCDKDWAIIFTTGRLPEINPP
jgi:hypothetical protein